MDYYVSQKGLEKLVELGMMNYAVFETLVKMKADTGEILGPGFVELADEIDIPLADFCGFCDGMLASGLLIEVELASYDLSPEYFRMEE